MLSNFFTVSGWHVKSWVAIHEKESIQIIKNTNNSLDKNRPWLVLIYENLTVGNR